MTDLNKDITRETTEEVDEKKLVITVTKDQKIRIKQKGKNGKEIEIPIKELFLQLIKGAKTLNEDSAMISLTDFRSQYLTDAGLSLDTKVVLEQITTRLLRNQ